MIQCLALLLEGFLSFSFNCRTVVRDLHLVNLDQVVDNMGGFLSGLAGALLGVFSCVGAVAVVAWFSSPAAHALVVIGMRG